jgi:signal transduction histidine kinase
LAGAEKVMKSDDTVALRGEPTIRILIVDDEATQMKALCDTLEDNGYETVGFTAGPAALAALRETRFDLLLTDLMMPEMDGLDLLRAAQEIDPALVAIIMTGQGTIDTAVEAMKANALDYILKPFKLSVILPVIARALTVRGLRVKNAELERSVTRYTAELEAANKELEAFSYSVSHDLRAPVRAIAALSGILLKEFSPQMADDARQISERVHASARRMVQLIDDLLRFSHLSREPLSKEPVNVGELIRSVVEELRREQGDRKIEIEIGDLTDCNGDPSLLRQVFVNLLSNAFKFTRRKEAARIEVGCRPGNAETIYFVKDNGAGFDMKDVGTLFGVFQRFHGADEFEGTGVGLSIVQRIVQRHGGRVWAEAAVDQGATFYVALPK